MDVSIIIVNYNTKQITANCIESIFEHTADIEFEVILIDNSSTDGSDALFEKDIRLVFMKSNTNLGFGKANNLGYSIAKGKYVFLLNSDTVILNNVVKIFYDSAENMSPNYACFGCLLQNIEGGYSSSIGDFLKIKNILLDSISVYTKYFGFTFKRWIKKSSIDERPFVTNVIIAADLFIRKNIIEKLGLFDPKFFMYHEENDLQRRYLENGFLSVIIDGPKIIHLEGVSRGNSINREILGIQGMFIYLKKWNSNLKYYFFIMLFILLRLPVAFYTKYSFNEKTKYFKSLFTSI